MLTTVHTVFLLWSKLIFLKNLLNKINYCVMTFFLNGHLSHLKLTLLHDKTCYLFLFFILSSPGPYLIAFWNKRLFICHRKGLNFSKSDKDFIIHNNFRFHATGQEIRLIS